MSTPNEPFHLDPTEIASFLHPAALQFSQSRAIKISELSRFTGAGVYGIFLQDPTETLYEKPFSGVSDYPIYIGKAIPTGSRRGLETPSKDNLYRRLREHVRTLKVSGIHENKFRLRYLTITGAAIDLIPAIESYLIRRYTPLWNTVVDGFGIHTPGKGRYHQQRSEWDTLHHGRTFADKLLGAPRDREALLDRINRYQVQAIKWDE